MKKFLIVLPMGILILANGRWADSENSRQTGEITIPFDLETERQLQIEVDKGHQPWRLVPIDVAHAAIITLLKVDVPFDKCIFLSEADREVTIKCIDVQSYTVRLKQLVRAKGIWTATQIQIGDLIDTAAIADGFQHRLQTGKQALHTRAGKEYEKALGPIIGDSIRKCILPGSAPQTGDFVLIGDVSTFGTVSSVEVRPSTPASRCFAEEL